MGIAHFQIIANTILLPAHTPGLIFKEPLGEPRHCRFFAGILHTNNIPVLIKVDITAKASFKTAYCGASTIFYNQ